MTSHSAEARLWQVLGMAFLVGGGLPLGLTILQIASRRLVEAEALQLGVAYAVMILIGFLALVAARVLTAKDGVRHQLDWIWTVTAWGAIPLGAAIFDLEWGQSGMSPVALSDKASLLSGGFIFMIGLIALAGERVVQHIQYTTLRKTIDGVERSLADASASRRPAN
jgi:hypothetical protein